MKININEFLNEEEIKECKRVALMREEEQNGDGERGAINARYAYGGYAGVDDRKKYERIEHHEMGAISEYIGSKVTRCEWRKESGQYKGNRRSDLSPIFRGRVVKCDVRGTRKFDKFIYRERDIRTPNTLLIAISNLPYGPTCEVGHGFFRDISKLVEEHPEWVGKHFGSKYYEIPFKYLSGDFSEFGK